MLVFIHTEIVWIVFTSNNFSLSPLHLMLRKAQIQILKKRLFYFECIPIQYIVSWDTSFVQQSHKRMEYRIEFDAAADVCELEIFAGYTKSKVLK